MKDYAAAERRADDARAILAGGTDAALTAERAERYAGAVRIERGPAAFRVTFPMLTAHAKGTPEAKAAWENAKRPMQDVKAIIGRKWDPVQGAWIVPLDMAQSVECLALDYGATIEDAAAVPAELAARIAELEAALRRAHDDWRRACDERDAALRLADEYAALLEPGEAVAA